MNSNATLKIQENFRKAKEREATNSITETREAKVILLPESDSFLYTQRASLCLHKLAVLRSETEQNLFESLILAQDERWRRA